MKRNLIPFKKFPQSQGPLVSEDGEIVDHGDLGVYLKYEIYKRGVIHIFEDPFKKVPVLDKRGLIFKKDITLFEKALEGLHFETLLEGCSHKIPGSGDNDDLVFEKTNGDINIYLKKKGFTAIETLKDILSKGKKALAS